MSVIFIRDWTTIVTKRCRPRKQKQIKIRAYRTILEMRRRERVFKPGPYRDTHGNARFLGKWKP